MVALISLVIIFFCARGCTGNLMNIRMQLTTFLPLFHKQSQGFVKFVMGFFLPFVLRSTNFVPKKVEPKWNIVIKCCMVNSDNSVKLMQQ